MDPGVTLCPHLGSLAAGDAAFTLAAGEILEWYDGPVAAIVRCAGCGAPGWIELLDRSPLKGSGLTIERPRELPRDVEL